MTLVHILGARIRKTRSHGLTAQRPCFLRADLFEEDARDFHAFYKALCDRYGPHLYPEYKALCDRYFYIPARKEHRGLGGIFFDDLSSLGGTERKRNTGTGTGTANGTGPPNGNGTMDGSGSSGEPESGSDGRNGNGTDGSGTDGAAADTTSERASSAAEYSEELSVSGRDADAGFERAWHFVRDVAEGFMPSYLPIAERARSRVWGDKERQWQLLRRGRYLEFNLLYDRGVKFGLDGGGRVESIMVSGKRQILEWIFLFSFLLSFS